MSDQPTDYQASVGLWSATPPTQKITTKGILYTFLNTCWHAQTLEAYSAQFKCTVFIALPCKQWSCRHCAEVKIRQLSVKTQRAKPNRLLTLTVDPSNYENPRHAFDETRRKVPEVMRALRKRYDEVEYLRVTELTSRGWPHYHLMVRSPYIPHAVVKTIWKDLTGALIVDLRQIKQALNTYTYLVKYLSKMHKIGWTDRHVSYSRNFFPKEESHEKYHLDLSEQTVIESHPSTYLYARFRGATLTMIGPNLYALDPNHDAVQDIVASDEWTQCADKPSRDHIFPANTPKKQTPQPQFFPTRPEVHNV